MNINDIPVISVSGSLLKVRNYDLKLCKVVGSAVTGRKWRVLRLLKTHHSEGYLLMQAAILCKKYHCIYLDNIKSDNKVCKDHATMLEAVSNAYKKLNIGDNKLWKNIKTNIIKPKNKADWRKSKHRTCSSSKKKASK